VSDGGGREEDNFGGEVRVGDAEAGADGAAQRVADEDWFGDFVGFDKIGDKLAIIIESEGVTGGVGEIGSVEVELRFEKGEERVE